MKKQIEKIKKSWHEHPKVWRIGLISAAVLLVLWLGWIWWKVDSALTRTDPSANANSDTAIKFVPSPLTGVQVAEDLAKRPIFAVQIENSPEARPQSGLAQAGVVFEAVAEGGITRFTAYYQEVEPKKIGPVRSLRPYYIDFLLGFDAAVAHVGASVQAKAMIPSLGVKSLDVSGAYYRAADRYAPHNAYTDYGRLKSTAQRLGYYKEPNFTPIKRKDASPAETVKAGTINIPISSSLYNVSYGYNKDCNCYRRSQAGAQHKERETGQQLSPEVVVVIQASHSVISSVGHMGIDIIGSGKGWVFQDGNVHKITWKKSDKKAQMTFTDGEGNEVGLNPGQTWFTVIGTDKSASFKP